VCHFQIELLPYCFRMLTLYYPINQELNWVFLFSLMFESLQACKYKPSFQSPFTSGDPVMVSQVFTVPRRLTGFSGYCSFKICWILQQFYIVLHGECSLCTIQVFSRVSCSTIFCLPPLRIMSSLPVSCCLNMVDRELWLPVTLPLMFLLG
jgi:hypothetical protein